MALKNVQASKAFPSIQLGVGISGGTERALHAVQAEIELCSFSAATDNSVSNPNTDVAVLSIDMKNAFNNRSRAAIAKAIPRMSHCCATRSLVPLGSSHSICSSYLRPIRFSLFFIRIRADC